MTATRSAAPTPWLQLARRAAAYRRPLAAACAALAVVCTVAALHPRTATVGVVVAAQDLPSGTTLTSGELTVTRWPVALAPAGSVDAPGALVGRVLAGALRRGEPVTDVQVLSGASLAQLAGARLVAAPVRIADAGAAALLAPGDRVDVLAAADGQATGNAPLPPASEVARDARVLIVSPDTSDAGGLIVLAVDPATADRLAAAQAARRLSVILLPG